MIFPKDGEWLSVIIKPTKEVIVDTIRYGDYALLNTEYGSAIQIPKGHGRLIDGDELAKRCDSPYWCVWLSEIDDAPTILEAEE